MSLVGIDAGGNKTRVLVAEDPASLDSSAASLQNIKLPGLNVSTHGLDAVRRMVSGLERELRIASPAETKVFGGFAGIETEDQARAVENVFIENGYRPNNVTAVNDGQLWLKALGGDGVVLALGTGSVCVGQIEQKIYKKGGWGYVLGDEASGYYLGQRGINAAIHHSERWSHLQNSKLLEAALEHFGETNLKEIIPRVYGPSGPDIVLISRFAPKVLELSMSGDRAAIEIVKDGAKLAAEHVSALCMEAGVSRTRLGLIGGIFDSPHSGFLREEIQESLLLSGYRIEYVDLGEGVGKEDPLRLALKHHFKAA